MERRWLGASERAAPWVAGLLITAPILIVRYPPMGDLAMHEALVAIVIHRHDPTWAPPGLYEVVAPQANQLFHWLAVGIGAVASTRTACKLVVALSLFVTPPAAARLLRRLHLSPWLALLACPIACGWMFRWGLVANLTGLAGLLLGLPSLEALARRPSSRALAASLLAVPLLFFAHESAALVFAIVAGAFALVRGRSLGGVAVRIAPAAAFGVLAVVQWRIAAPLLGANMRSIGTYFGPDVGDRVAMLPGAVFGAIGAPRLWILGGLWGAALVASVVARGGGRSAPLRVAIWRHRYAVLAMLFLFCFLVCPMAIGGATLVAYRFLPAAAVCLVAACAARARSWPVVVLAAIAPVATVGVEADDFRKADRSHRALDAVIAQVPMDVAVAQLDLTPRPASRVAPVPGAASRVQAERGGRMLFALTDMPPNPVYVPAEYQWNEPVARMSAAPYALMPDVDLRRFSYLLVRNDAPAMRPVVAEALAPEADRIAAEGEWTLFRSRLPVAPLTSADAALPAPAPEALADRVNRLLAKRAPAP